MPPIVVRKKYGYTASVAHGSNKVIACSKANWDVVRDGSFILLDKDSSFYRVVDKKRFAYRKEVTVLNTAQLKINEPVGTMLGPDDDISFSYNEYHIVSAEIDHAGEGYEVNDVLTPTGGIYKYNSIDQIDLPAQITVKEVDNAGGITSVELTVKGSYIVAPDDSCSVSSNLGEGATLNITSKASDIISIEDRTISSVELNEDHTVLHLNHDLPPRVSAGEIKVNKWELVLNVNYAGEDRLSVDYDIIKDFTPHNDIPLLNGDLTASHLLYNEGMAIIDQRLKDLEDKLS